MKILAIEFSSDQRSVAVVADGQVKGAASESAGRATHALTLVGEALTHAGLEREDIQCLAIGLGPGSYAGIRAAIALAQGWQLALGEAAVKLIGISSAECLAAEAQAKGWFGQINVAIDAQRGELYLAGYDVSAAAFRETRPLKLASLDEVRSLGAAGETIVGPDATRWVPSGRILFPTADMLGLLAVGRTGFTPGNQMEPIYLRETTFVKAPPPRALPT
jgi:tRNA threonylcarbamoyl adenosine modification protein YeaZ